MRLRRTITLPWILQYNIKQGKKAHDIYGYWMQIKHNKYEK